MLTLKFKTLKRKEKLTNYPWVNPGVDQPLNAFGFKKILAGPPERSFLAGKMGQPSLLGPAFQMSQIYDFPLISGLEGPWA